MPGIRVAVVSDWLVSTQPFVSGALQDPDFHLLPIIAGSAPLLHEFRPDVILLDAIHYISHLQVVVRSLSRQAPSSQIVMLGVSGSQDDVPEAFEAGAVALLEVSASAEQVRCTIESVRKCGAIWSYRFSPRAFERLEEITRTVLHLRLLAQSGVSFRELGVLRLLASGLTNQEIAGRLSVSVHTIKNHVHRILAKVRVRSRSDLIAKFRGAC